MDLPPWKELAPIFAVLSPIFVLLLSGLWLNKSLEKLKSRLQLNHAIIQKRADIYAEIQEDLNSIYSYIKRVGNWKALTPMDILEHKRKVDQKIHSTKPYWSKDMLNNYNYFMKTCFVTNRGHKIDAGIVAEVDKYKKLDSWNGDFEIHFDGIFNETTLDKANDNLMSALSKDFGVE